MGDNRPTIDVVISRYNENLLWIYQEPYHNFFSQPNVKVTIYNKSKNLNFTILDGWSVIQLPNIGMCDHTYLYHIVTNYDHLADITIFLPGSIERPHKESKTNRLIREIRDTQGGIFLHNHYDEDGIRNNHYHFTLDYWAPSYDENYESDMNASLISASIRPYGAWFDAHFGAIVEPRLTYLGIFSIDRRDIVQHPVERYQRLLDEFPENGRNVEVAHYIERAWCAIFHPMTHTKFVTGFW